MSASHWLQITLQRAGIAGADRLGIEPGASVDAAWTAALRVLNMPAADVASRIASRFHLRLAEIEDATPTSSKLVPPALARKHHVLPLREDDREIVVATADPTDLEAEQAIGFASGRQVTFEIAAPQQIRDALDRTYPPDAAVQSLMRQVDAERAESVRVVHGAMTGAVARADSGESAAVVKLTNLILRTAIDAQATALEIAPGAGSAAVSLLVDGVWSRLMPLPVPAAQHVMDRLRVLGNVGIANRTWSRDGVARIRVEGRTYDLLVTQTVKGPDRSARVRIYDQQFTPLLADLAIEPATEARLRTLLTGEGLVVVAGPPDSGVGTLHYAMLRELARQGRPVALVEDGLRWDLHGVEHVPVAPGERAAAVSAVAARMVDAIGIDEIEDGATAAAIADALAPGRLIIVREGRGDSPAARERLEHLLGPERTRSIAPTFVGVRLVRRACPACRGAGCDACRRSGYRGMLPLVAILAADEVADEYAHLSAAAQLRVAEGETVAAEFQRVFGSESKPRPETRPTLVLVADDDPLIRLLARTVLEADGLAAADAEDGEEALRRIGEAADIDLLVLDLDMPKLDGHAVLARLKKDVHTAGLPVIVLTASLNPQDEARALEQGAADYIRKPIDPPRFQARVRAVLRRNGG